MLINMPDTLLPLCLAPCRLRIESNEGLRCLLTVRDLTGFRVANETTYVQVNYLTVVQNTFNELGRVLFAEDGPWPPQVPHNRSQPSSHAS